MAFAVTMAWCIVLALDGDAANLPAWTLLGMDAVRYLAWFAAMLSLAALPITARLRRASTILCIALLVAALLIPIIGKLAGQPLESGRWMRWGGLLLSLAGFVLIEQLLRNSSSAAVRPLKLCAIGIGGQFAFDLFLYSRAELLMSMDFDAWVARGFVLAALIPVLLIGYRQQAGEQPTLFVSRQVVFYTTSIFAVGIYLMSVSVGGYYVRLHGGSWGDLLRLLFLVGAVLVLAILLVSGNAWRRLKTFISKHFYRNKFDYRAEWLRFINTLSTPVEQDSRLTAIRSIAQIFASPGGVLYMKSETGAQFEMVSTWTELPTASMDVPPAVPSNSGLVEFLDEREWVIDLVEYERAPAMYGHVDLPGWLLKSGNRFRIVEPLLELDELVGFLALQSPPEPFEMTFEDRDLLKTVGRHVATLLAQHAADRKLTESRQFDAFNRFAAFVMHDLKNSVAQLQLLVANAARHRYNPAFMDDAIETIANSVDRMTRLIDQLQTRDPQSLEKPVNIGELLRASVMRSTAREPAPDLPVVSPGVLVLADPERLGSVLDHIIRNAQEAAGPAGCVSARLESQKGDVMVSICDNGAGMEADFIRDRLFRPFDSTKGSKGMGIGAYQAREYVRRLNGSIEVQSNPGVGTTFIIRLPQCQIPVAES
jgi:putative PEP-CTERM system histidine kinase